MLINVELFVGSTLRIFHALSRSRTLTHKREEVMEVDTDRIVDAVLALLSLGLHNGYRAWKSFDWDAMSRPHEKGYISVPVSKAKSVAFTEEGLRRSELLFQELFAKH